MAKLGMSKGKPPIFTGKLGEEDLDKVVNSNLPPKEFFAKYAADSMSEVQGVLRGAVDSARSEFVNRLSQELEMGFEDGDLPILPDRTRFFRSNGEQIILMLEVSPHVRTIDFNITGDRAVTTAVLGIPRKDRYRLAFPYCVFTLKIIHEEGKYHFQRLYIAYRKSPLTGNRKDMLYLPNTLNTGLGGSSVREVRSDHDNERDGYSRTDTDMGVCMGSGYACQESSLVAVVKEVLNYFWMVPFNSDLEANFLANASRDSRVATVSAWEKLSEGNSLDLLRVDWKPAMPLGDFLNILLSQGENRVRVPATRRMNSVIGKVYEEVWREVKARNLDNGRLATALMAQVENVMKKFAAKLGVGLSSLPHDTVRRQVQIAVAEALRESMR
jgi:hypothetical protein